jgi:hypothetical protein
MAYGRTTHSPHAPMAAQLRCVHITLSPIIRACGHALYTNTAMSSGRRAVLSTTHVLRFGLHALCGTRSVFNQGSISGIPSTARPVANRLTWCHTASVRTPRMRDTVRMPTSPKAHRVQANGGVRE